jgi:hypothetical protein
MVLQLVKKVTDNKPSPFHVYTKYTRNRYRYYSERVQRQVEGPTSCIVISYVDGVYINVVES